MSTLNVTTDTIANIVYSVTDAIGAPIIDRSRNICAIYESFFNESEGAVCYRVCGPIPRGREPEKVEYFTRLSNQDDETPWEACDGDGCQAEEMKFQAATGTLCSQFRLWKGHGEHRDLLVEVTLAEA